MRVVDLAHGVRSIRSGSVIMAQSVVHAPGSSVHLAVVDPGVGTDRRAVAIVAGRGDLLVGPDNGLLQRAADALGGAVAAFELTDPRVRLEPVSSTFHGRDLFAPAAAYLALGVLPSEMGAEISVGELVRLTESPPVVSDGVLEADVARVDWYGNLQLDATDDDFERSRLGGRAVLTCPAGAFEVTIGRTFADAEADALVAYVDSGGHVAVARNGSSARELLQDPERVTLKRNK